MSSPYSGATPSGASAAGPMTTPIPTTTGYSQQDYTESTPNYAADYAANQPPVSGNIGTPINEAGRPDIEGTSVGTLIGEVTKDLSTLMRQELELAKAEIKVEAKKAGQGAGMFGAAGFAGYMVLMFLSFALWWALANVMDVGLAALIVAILWGVIGAVAFVMGRKKFQQVNPKPERTVETLQQVPGALKPNN
jgi:Putative Actinobacterial Holin-X, holin superfamily III